MDAYVLAEISADPPRSSLTIAGRGSGVNSEIRLFRK